MTNNVVPLHPIAPQARNTANAKHAFAFSKTTIRKAIEDAGDATGIEFRDDGCRGLILRKQTKDWFFAVKRKVNGKLRRATIERWSGSNDVQAVRADAEQIMADMKAGTYMPAKERAAVQEKVDALASLTYSLENMTLSAAVDLHLKVNPALRPKTVEVYRYAVRLYGSDALVSELTTDSIRTAYTRVLNNQSAATAHQMLRSIRTLWTTWAEEHPEDQEPTRNPASRVAGRKRGVVQKVEARDNALRPGERRAWFDACLGLNTTAGTALAFVFLTGLRRNEAFHMPWSEVDLDAGTVTISAERMKSVVVLTRPITPQMRLILEAQRAQHPKSKFVFPTPTGNGPISEARKTLKRVNALALAEGRSVTIHDLRRTYIAAGGLSGIPDVGLKLLVAHSTTDITQTYLKALKSELGVFAERVENELMGDRA